MENTPDTKSHFEIEKGKIEKDRNSIILASAIVSSLIRRLVNYMDADSVYTYIFAITFMYYIVHQSSLAGATNRLTFNFENLTRFVNRS